MGKGQYSAADIQAVPDSAELGPSLGMPSGVTKPNIQPQQEPPSMFDRIKQAAGVGVNMLTQSPGAVSTQDISGVPSAGEQTSQGLGNVATGRPILGAAQLAGAGMDVATPFAGPAGAENPRIALRALLGGSAGQYLGTGAARLVGASPEAQQASGTAGALLGGAAANIGSIKRGLTPGIDEATAAESIKNAVNPNPADVPRFNQAAEGQLARIKDYAQRTGQPINTRADFLNAVKGAQSEQTATFYDKMLKPIANERVASPSGFQGTTIGEGGNQTTLQALDQRLTAINKLVKSGYDRGNPMSSEQLQAYNAEAAQIRQALYQNMGQRLGIDPAKIAEVRNNIGALGELHGQSQMQFNTQQANINTQAQKPLTLNPFQAADSPQRFILDPVTNKLVNAVRGNPTDNAIAQTFRRLNSSAPITPNVNPPSGAAPNRSPSWLNNPGTGPRPEHIMEALRQHGMTDIDETVSRGTMAGAGDIGSEARSVQQQDIDRRIKFGSYEDRIRAVQENAALASPEVQDQGFQRANDLQKRKMAQPRNEAPAATGTRKDLNLTEADFLRARQLQRSKNAPKS